MNYLRQEILKKMRLAEGYLFNPISSVSKRNTHVVKGRVLKEDDQAPSGVVDIGSFKDVWRDHIVSNEHSMQIDLEEPRERLVFYGVYDESSIVREEISEFKKRLIGWKRVS
jgi:hypothetical protein